VKFEIRTAIPADRETIQQLIAISARELSRGYYSEEQVSAAQKSVYGEIRAFFIHPNFARQGIGKAILDRCEMEATRQGFISLELMSTLPGVEFYRACGFVATDPISYDAAGVALKFVPIKKMLPR
jgi:GNAT superfamily N-acetyltransferase